MLDKDFGTNPPFVLWSFAVSCSFLQWGHLPLIYCQGFCKDKMMIVERGVTSAALEEKQLSSFSGVVFISSAVTSYYKISVDVKCLDRYKIPNNYINCFTLNSSISITSVYLFTIAICNLYAKCLCMHYYVYSMYLFLNILLLIFSEGCKLTSSEELNFFVCVC